LQAGRERRAQDAEQWLDSGLEFDTCCRATATRSQQAADEIKRQQRRIARNDSEPFAGTGAQAGANAGQWTGKRFRVGVGNDDRGQHSIPILIAVGADQDLADLPSDALQYPRYQRATVQQLQSLVGAVHATAGAPGENKTGNGRLYDGVPSADQMAYAIAEKQLYSSHYFQTALDLTFCLRDRGNPKRSGFYLIKAMGSEQAGLTGIKGSIVRKVAVGRTASSLEKSLAAIRNILEAKQ